MVIALLITLAVMIATGVCLLQYCETKDDFLAFENLFVQRLVRILFVLSCCIVLILPFLGDWLGIINAPRFGIVFIQCLSLFVGVGLWLSCCWGLLWLGEKLIQCLQMFWQWIWGK